jgi:curved DNA-binding protein CbpA
MPKIHTHYDNLKVSRNAPNSVIRAAYKALIQQYHPDKFEGSEDEALRITKLIKESYEVLIDPIKRGEHNRWIDEQEAKAKQQNEKTQFEANYGVNTIFCNNCGILATDNAGYCFKCGAVLTDAPSVHEPIPPKKEATIPVCFFFSTSTLKLGLMSICTFGLYEAFWFYKNWLLIRERTGQNISPSLRALFSTIWAYSCFKHINNFAQKKNVEESVPAIFLAISYFFLWLSWNLPGQYWLISLLSFVTIIPANNLATNLNKRLIPGFNNNDNFSAWNWAAVFFGTTALIFSFLPKTDNQNQVSSQIYYSDSRVTSSETPSFDGFKSSTQAQNSASIKNIYIKNECRETISASVAYLGINEWLTKGWWVIQPGAEINTGEKTSSKDIYVFAYSANFQWKGDKKNGILREVSNIDFTSSDSVRFTGGNVYFVPFKPAVVNSVESYYEVAFACH